MKKGILLFATTIALLTVMGCGMKKKESKSMEQIQKEEGIPVRTMQIQPSVFIKSNTYNAVLSGIEESKVTSMVGDVVYQINAQVGDFVKKDQVIVTFPQDTPAAHYVQAHSSYQNSKSLFERMQRLFAKGAISQQDMDNAETAFKVTQANFNAAKDIVFIKAPINGYLTSLNVSAGQLISAGTTLFTVSNTSKYKAEIWIPENEIYELKKGLRAEAVWNDEILSGKITSLSMAMDNDKKAFRGEVIFNSRTKFIACGVTVQISIETVKIPNAIVIDRQYISDNGKTKFVWLVENNKAIKKEIKTRHDNGIDYEVISGLSAGDNIISEGFHLVDENNLVKVITPGEK